MINRKRIYFYAHSRDEAAAALEAFLSAGLPTYDQLLTENRRLRKTVEDLGAKLLAVRGG